MLNDAIRMIACAFCSEARELRLQVQAAQPLENVKLLLLQITASAEISLNGEAKIRPITRIPDRTTIRFRTLPKDLFFLFAGAAAKLNLVMRTEAVEGGVTRQELQALSDALDGVLVYAKRKNLIILSSVTVHEGLTPDAAVPDAFAAGLLLGACLSAYDTDFDLGELARSPAVNQAIEAISSFGGKTEQTEGGALRVYTLRSRFNKATGRRIRKKKESCS